MLFTMMNRTIASRYYALSMFIFFRPILRSISGYALFTSTLSTFGPAVGSEVYTRETMVIQNTVKMVPAYSFYSKIQHHTLMAHQCVNDAHILYRVCFLLTTA
jgi:hypothetical protein